MINREMETVLYEAPTNGYDAYGQRKYSTATPIEMQLKKYIQMYVNDPKFNDVEYVGLTYADVEEGGIVNGNMLILNIAEGRLKRCLLKSI